MLTIKNSNQKARQSVQVYDRSNDGKSAIILFGDDDSLPNTWNRVVRQYDKPTVRPLEEQKEEAIKLILMKIY